MKPASMHTTTTDGLATSILAGMLENPEVLENVPGHVIPIIKWLIQFATTRNLTEAS